MQILDRIGIAAFALGGVEIGARRRLDVFGLVVMGVVAATGGGLLRDVMIGRTPFVLEHWDYLALAVAFSVVGIFFVWRGRSVPEQLLTVAGAAGLGAFAAAGALAGIESELPLPAVVVLAIVTATGGGVIRDLLAGQVPLVLRVEANATAAAIGGVVVWALDPASTGWAALVGTAAASAVRLVTGMRGLHLPAPGGRGVTMQRGDDDYIS